MENGLKSLDKAIAVLKSFTANDMELGVSEIAEKTRIPISTSHRIISALVKHRLLERRSGSAKYSVGPELYVLGALYLSSADLISSSTPIAQALSRMSGEIVTVAVLSGDSVVLVVREDSPSSLRLSHHVGTILPAHATSYGKVLLSELTEAAIDLLYPDSNLKTFTAKTLKTKSQLKDQLNDIREKGVAYALEEYQEGTLAVASAIRDNSGRAIAGLALGTFKHTCNARKMKRLTDLAIMGATLISYRLGYASNERPIRSIDDIYSWWENRK